LYRIRRLGTRSTRASCIEVKLEMGFVKPTRGLACLFGDAIAELALTLSPVAAIPS
jgi:hypothetical protein